MRGAVLKEALVIGIVLAIIYAIVLAGTNKLAGDKLNHTVVMILAAFISGAVAHLGLEAAGVNKWYCNNGAACQP